MRHKLKLIHWRSAASLLMLVTLFSIDTVQAQCPGDSYGILPSVSTNPWYGEFCTTQLIPGTSCHIEICYCQRAVSSGTQVWITSITPDNDGTCDGISNEYIIQQAMTLVLNGVVTVPCFKGTQQLVEVYRASCWSEHPIDPQHPDLLVLSPCPTSGWCQKTCYGCADENGVHTSGCTTSNLQGTASCEIPIVNWQQNQCYTILCEQ